MAEQGLSWLVLAHPGQIATGNLWSGSQPLSVGLDRHCLSMLQTVRQGLAENCLNLG